MMTNPSDQYIATPLEDNLFEWHFTLRGPKDSAFSGGVYHGRILLPSEYPFKPPHILFLTPNGRFAIKQKICLSISAYHPEMWQPAWGIRLICEALISFFPTPSEGAIGALDYSDAERRALARASVMTVCPICCGEGETIADLLPVLKTTTERDTTMAASPYADVLSQLHFVAPKETSASSKEDHPEGMEATSKSFEERPPAKGKEDMKDARMTEDFMTTRTMLDTTATLSQEKEKDPTCEDDDEDRHVEEPVEVLGMTEDVTMTRPAATEALTMVVGPVHDAVDTFLVYVATALAVLLFGLLYYKALTFYGIIIA